MLIFYFFRMRLERLKSFSFFFFFLNGPKVWCFYFILLFYFYLTNVDYLPKSQSCHWLWLLLKEGGTGADGKMTTEIFTQIWAWVSVAQVAIWTSKILTGCHGDSSLHCQKGPEKSPASEARTLIFLYLRFSFGHFPCICTKLDHSLFIGLFFKWDAATFLYIICLNKATVSDSFYDYYAYLFLGVYKILLNFLFYFFFNIFLLYTDHILYYILINFLYFKITFL